MSQVTRIFKLLSDRQPHRVDEIVQKVYEMDGSTICRVAARINDLKREGYVINSWHDKANRKLWYYQMISFPCAINPTSSDGKEVPSGEVVQGNLFSTDQHGELMASDNSNSNRTFGI